MGAIKNNFDQEEDSSSKDKTPGFGGSVFSSAFLGTILSVLAVNYPTTMMWICGLLAVGGIAEAIKKDQSKQKRFQMLMCTAASGFALMIALAATKAKTITQPTPASPVKIAEPTKRTASNPIADAFATEPTGTDWYIIDPVDGHGVVIQAVKRPVVTLEYKIDEEIESKSILEPEDIGQVKTEAGSKGLAIISAADIALIKKFDSLIFKPQYANLKDKELYNKLAPLLGITPSRLKGLSIWSSIIDRGLHDGEIIDKRPVKVVPLGTEHVLFEDKLRTLGVVPDAVVTVKVGYDDRLFAKIVVSNLWHTQHYQRRLQMAQNLLKIWNKTCSSPGWCRIQLIDINGNEVGGMKSSDNVWVQEI